MEVIILINKFKCSLNCEYEVVNVGQEYAKILRTGEGRRDASSKIRGFLYQDLVAIREIFNDEKQSNILIEWVEDIFIENDDLVEMIQVKYYPKSVVDFNAIYEDMFYQFLKFKLVFSSKKVIFKCVHKSSTEFNEEESKVKLLSKFTTQKLIEDSITTIWNKHNEKSNFPSRKEYLFEGLGCSELLNEFSLRIEISDDFSLLRENVSEMIYSQISDLGSLSFLTEQDSKSLLLSSVIDYIQKKYYRNSDNINQRIITKEEILAYIDNLVFGLDNKHELISTIVLEVIDEIFSEIVDYQDEYDGEVVNWYSKLYFQTKRYYSDLLKFKDSRFRLINTICTDKNHVSLNYETYSGYKIYQERDLFIENRKNLKSHILILWKLLFNINYDREVSLNSYILEIDYGLLFNISDEPKSPVLVISEVQRSAVGNDVSKTISRVDIMHPKPTKWYMGIPNNKMKVFNYSYDIGDIREAMVNEVYEIDDIVEDSFIIECMDCLKCSTFNLDMSKSDDLNECVFSSKCVGGL